MTAVALYLLFVLCRETVRVSSLPPEFRPPFPLIYTLARGLSRRDLRRIGRHRTFDKASIIRASSSRTCLRVDRFHPLCCLVSHDQTPGPTDVSLRASPPCRRLRLAVSGVRNRTEPATGPSGNGVPVWCLVCRHREHCWDSLPQPETTEHRKVLNARPQYSEYNV